MIVRREPNQRDWYYALDIGGPLWTHNKDIAEVFNTEGQAAKALRAWLHGKDTSGEDYTILIEPAGEITQESIDPDAVDPRQYLGALTRPWGIVYIAPTLTPEAREGVEPGAWYTGNPFDRWAEDPEKAHPFNTKERAESFMKSLKTGRQLISDIADHLTLMPIPIIQQEAIDPDAVDPNAYLRGIQPYYGIALWTKGSASEGRVWYTDDAWDYWGGHSKDAKKFTSKTEAERFLELNRNKKILQPHEFNTIDVEILPGLWQEALDPDAVRSP